MLVIEDTSDLLRAQKAAAWHEVARRIAHELKNPLTPIALSAERIARLLDRGGFPPDSHRILRECAGTISREVESVKTLADEFSQFSRFPAAQPIVGDLNNVVRNALDVFAGRLDAIDLRVDLAADLPSVHVDPEQFKRVVVNLVDNAAEAMRDSPGAASAGGHPRHRRRYRGAAGGRYRMRHLRRRQRTPVPALLFHQGTRHRPGLGNREPHSGRTRRRAFASKTTVPRVRVSTWRFRPWWPSSRRLAFESDRGSSRVKRTVEVRR